MDIEQLQFIIIPIIGIIATLIIGIIPYIIYKKELPIGATMDPEELRAYEEFHIDFLKLLQEIALNRLAEVYRGLMSQETMIIQGREYPADFRGDGYIGANEYPWLNG